jgi:hypothetical protein
MAGSRRSGRIAKEIPILLTGTDTAGHFFAEETKTVVLSRHGAGILSRHRLAPDELLAIRLPDTAIEAPIRLVGQMAEEAEGFTYGVEFLDADLDFWQIPFPPPPRWQTDADTQLECSLCHRSERIHQTEIEADVYALLQNILRFCPTCGISTLWRKPSADRVLPPKPLSRPPAKPPDAPSRSQPAPALIEEFDFAPAHVSASDSSVSSAYSSEAPLALTGKDLYGVAALASPDAPAASSTSSAPPAPASDKANRRVHLRSRVNFTARIRSEFGDEIAESDDISKGGFSFRSRQSYPLNSLIEVALPYSPGWDAMFVPARIKHIEKLPGGALFRYGAAYTSPPKSRRNP